MPNLRKIEAAVPTIREKKKVAAYARVSMQSERMLHSLSAQVSYYSGLIQKNPDWNTPAFMQMILFPVPIQSSVMSSSVCSPTAKLAKSTSF